MTRTRNLADLLDSSGDVKTAALDNVSTTTLGSLGVTATAAELNYVDGVTSAIQTQIDNISTELVNDTTPQLGGNLDTNGNDINFGDNDKAVFGAGSDLQIYHDGNNSLINDLGTGDLRLRSNGSGVIVEMSNGNDLAQFLNSSGEAKLMHNGFEKLATTSTGIDVTGNIVVSGNVDGRDVAADGTKLDGIESGATADQTASEILTLIKTVDGTGSGLDADTLDGVDSSHFLRSNVADTKTSGDLSFADNVKAQFGAGNDLQIYHNGTNSIIEENSGAGSLIIKGTNIAFEDGTGAETYATFIKDGAATIRYDNATKLTTTSTGIDVTGDVLADTMTLDNGASDWQFSVSGNNLIISYGGTSKAKLDSSGNLTVVGDVTAFGTI